MEQSKEKLQNLMLYVVDAISLVFSYALSGIIWMVFYKKINDFDKVGNVLESELGTLLIAYVLIVLFFNVNRNFIKRGRFEELKYVFKMNMMFAASFSVLLFMKGSSGSLSRGTYFLTIIINVFVMYILHRLLKYYLFKIRRESKKINRVLLMTVYDRVESSIEKINHKEEWNNKIEGIILIDSEMIGEEINDIPVVAKYDDMLDYVRCNVVDEVLIDFPYDTGKGLKTVITELEDMGVVVNLCIDKLEEFKEFNKSLKMFGDLPVVTFSNVFYDYNKLILKRLMDIIGALIGIVLTCIITIFVAPALLIESPGPLIFRQKRVGKNGRYFYIYKFRSMHKDAEARKKDLMDKNEMNGLMFKMTDDPRITKVGKFIRKTSIDELPQFFNVLRGDMSLVGTRPPTVDEFKLYEGHHKRRLSMKPGLTGLWQVSGRSDIDDFEEVVKLDLEYIDNWSIGLDIKIILKTIWVILFGRGAK